MDVSLDSGMVRSRRAANDAARDAVALVAMAEGLRESVRACLESHSLMMVGLAEGEAEARAGVARHLQNCRDLAGSLAGGEAWLAAVAAKMREEYGPVLRAAISEMESV